MKNFLFSFFAAAAFSAHSQGLPYQFSFANEPYSQLPNTAQNIAGVFWNEDMVGIPLGFETNFYGRQADSVYVLADQAILWIDESDLEEPTLESRILFPFFACCFEPIAGSRLAFLTEGAPGEKVFKLEFRKVHFEDGGPTDLANFQIWIFEKTGDIEFRYGSINVNPDLVEPFANGIGAHVGLWAGAVAPVGQEIYISKMQVIQGDPTAPQDSMIFDYSLPDSLDWLPFSLTGLPASGDVYRFSSGVLSENEPFSTSKSLEIWPNPAADQLFWKSSEAVDRVEIFDAQGRCLRIFEKPEKARAIDLEKLPVGVFWLRTSGPNGSAVTPFSRF